MVREELEITHCLKFQRHGSLCIAECNRMAERLDFFEPKIFARAGSFLLPPIFAFSFLAACAGRAPAPVSVVQPQDRYLDCKAILIEVEANNQKVTQLASEEGLKVAQNVAAGVAGIVVPVLWFGMDWQGAAGKEVAALQSRQQYLAALAEERCRPPAEEKPAKKKK